MFLFSALILVPFCFKYAQYVPTFHKETFNDGTCIESRVEGGYTETSRWSLKDNKLTLSYSDGYSDVLTINELTATKLVLAFEDWDNLDDGSLELDDITTTTYKKID